MKGFEVNSPYLRQAEAAAYVRFSLRQFLRFVERDNIPSCGPGGRLYRKTDLDAWVENPATFRVQGRPVRRFGRFTPVEI
jgi:excisionase family DNA binding protein